MMQGSNIVQAEGRQQRTHRDKNFDSLKAAAIVGVVCCHSGLPFARIFAFCVPAFIGIWAFYLERGLINRQTDIHQSYISKRVKQIVIPYLFWTFLYLAINYPLSLWISTPIHTIVGGWFGGYGWAGQYYFIILFQLTLLFPIVRKWINRENFLVIILVGYVLNVVSYYVLFDNNLIRGIHDRLFFYWTPYVVLGIALARGYIKAVPKIGFLGLLLMLIATREIGTFDNRSAYLCASVIGGSLSLILASAPTTQEKQLATKEPSDTIVNRISEYLGKHTFSIFVSNILFLKLFSNIQSYIQIDMKNSLTMWISSAATVIFVISGGLLVSFVFKRLKLTILLGS